MGQVLGCIQVDQSTVAIRETFGKFDKVLEPGCHVMPWCIGQQLAGLLSLRVQQLDVRCETKTKDHETKERQYSDMMRGETLTWYKNIQLHPYKIQLTKRFKVVILTSGHSV